MEKLNNQELRDANRKSDFIFRNITQYESDPIFKSMIDNTQYFTRDEQIESMQVIGGQYDAGRLVGL